MRAALPRRGQDGSQNPADVLHHGRAAHAQNQHALTREPRITPLISLRNIGPLVYPTIDFNGQRALGAEEIQYPGSHRMLAAKLQAFQLASTKALPELHLRRAHMFAQVARAGEGGLTRVHDAKDARE